MDANLIYFYVIATLLVFVEKRAVFAHGVVSGMLFYFVLTTPTDAALVASHIAPTGVEETAGFISPYRYNNVGFKAGFWDRVAEYRGQDAVERCQKIVPLAEKVAKDVDISPQLIVAVAAFESGCDNTAISWAGAACMMQVMPFWVSGQGGVNRLLADPEFCIRKGAEILKMYRPEPWCYPIVRYYGAYHEGYVNSIWEMLVATGWGGEDGSDGMAGGVCDWPRTSR